MMNAAKRDRRIEFQRGSTTRNSLGGIEARSWFALGSRWASARFGASAERRAAAVEQAVQAATFRTLADALTRTVTVDDRIAYGGLVFDIVGIVPVGRGPEELEFTAMASRG